MINRIKPRQVAGFFVCGMVGRFGFTMKKVSLLLLFIISAILQSHPDTTWTNNLSGEVPEGGYSVLQTADGGYIVSGSISLHFTNIKFVY